MSKKILMIPLALIMCFAHCAELAEDAARRTDEATVWRKAKKAITQEERREAFKELYNLRGSVEIYGKVVDQWNDIVPCADIRVSWHSASWMLGKPPQHSNIFVQTDSSGSFTVILDHPDDATAYASKDGYESLLADSSASHLVANRTSNKTPVVLRLRKKGPTTFLFVSPGGSCPPDELFWTKGTNSLAQPLDLLTWTSGQGWRHCATPEADLRIDAAFDGEKKCWGVTYAVTNGAEGIIHSDSLLYEAPEKGYVARTTVSVTNQERGCYLYLKSRTPAIYSRMFFNHRYDSRGDQSLRVSCKAWVNPYGERNLEYDERAESVRGLAEGLANEAKAAILSGKYPPKPDISMRVKETSEQLQKERESRARFYNSPEFKRQRDENDRKNKEMLEKRKRQQEAVAGEK